MFTSLFLNSLNLNDVCEIIHQAANNVHDDDLEDDQLAAPVEILLVLGGGGEY